MNKLVKKVAIIMAAAMIFSVAGGCARSGGSSSKTIKVGVLEDKTGEFSLVGIQKLHADELAISEINKNGGLLGKKLVMDAPDTQSDNNRYQEMAKKLTLEDNVDVVMGCYSSASREAIRPIIEKNKSLLFYNNQYEGGVASHNVFCTGAVPEHQIATIIPYLIKKFGPKIYIIAADYNFGQISAQWVHKTASENGGTVIGEEFIPLQVSQFSSTISKIRAAKPDVLVTFMIGTAQSSFFEQWAKQGIQGLPMASTVNVAQAYEHKRFAPGTLANMYVTATYMEELDSPASNAFKDNWHKMFPDEPYIGQEAEAEYTGVYLWAEAVKKAGTTDKEKVIKALESGVSYNGPAGTVTIDGKTHHAIRDVYLVNVDDQNKVHFDQTWKSIVPDWLSKDKGIDLTKSSPYKQLTPLDN